MYVFMRVYTLHIVDRRILSFCRQESRLLGLWLSPVYVCLYVCVYVCFMFPHARVTPFWPLAVTCVCVSVCMCVCVYVCSMFPKGLFGLWLSPVYVCMYVCVYVCMYVVCFCRPESPLLGHWMPPVCVCMYVYIHAVGSHGHTCRHCILCMCIRIIPIHIPISYLHIYKHAHIPWLQLAHMQGPSLVAVLGRLFAPRSR